MSWRPGWDIIQRTAAAVVAGAWTPSSLGSDLLAWYSADSGVYIDAGSTLAADEETVQQWNDRSGNGYHLLQATSGLRPKYDTTGFNSNKGIVFDLAGTDYMGTGDVVAIGTGQAASAFVVINISNGSNYARVLQYIQPSGTDSSSSGSAAWILRDVGNDALNTFQGGGSAASQNITIGANIRFGMIYDGTNVTPYLNNVAGTGGANTHSWVSDGALGIGGDAGAVPFISAAYAEIVVTKSAISVGDRASLDSYFTTKWGL